jgi:RNA polymerase sigma factor (sigma-70 family)
MMDDVDDAELLRRYAREGAEEAFAELVRRHLGLVYGSALRRVNGNAALAEEVLQSVFSSVAHDAAGLEKKVAGGVALAGWLYVATRHAAANVLRAEVRRVRREQEAFVMSNLETNGGVGGAGGAMGASDDAVWTQVRPELEAVMDELSEADRDAVLLRFFEGKEFGEIGAVLRVSEDAARVRVNRALEKLRGLLAKRGVTSTAAALGGLLAGNAALAAPAGLASSVTGAALVSGVSAAAVSVNATSFLTFMSTTKIVVGVMGAVIFVGGFVLTLQIQANEALRKQTARLYAQVSELKQQLRESGATKAEAREAQPASSSGGAATIAQSLPARAGDADSEGRRIREKWGNVGRTTSAGAYETVMWASDRGDLDLLVTAFVLTDDQKKEAEATFNKLSDAQQKEYGSSEKMMALLFSSGTPTAFQVLSVTSLRPSEEVVKVRVWNNEGRANELELTFERHLDGWKARIPEWHMRKSMAKIR